MGERDRSELAQRSREHVAANLAQLRRQRGLTQAELAEIVHTEVRHLQYLESAQAAPGFDLLVDLAQALGVSVGELFEEAKLKRAGRGRPKKPGSVGTSEH